MHNRGSEFIPRPLEILISVKDGTGDYCECDGDYYDEFCEFKERIMLFGHY